MIIATVSAGVVAVITFVLESEYRWRNIQRKPSPDLRRDAGRLAAPGRDDEGRLQVHDELTVDISFADGQSLCYGAVTWIQHASGAWGE